MAKRTAKPARRKFTPEFKAEAVPGDTGDFSAHVEARRRRALWLALALAPAVANKTFEAAEWLRSGRAPPLILACFVPLLSAILLGVVLITNPLPSVRRIQLRVVGNDLFIGDRCLPIRDIVQAYLFDYDDGTFAICLKCPWSLRMDICVRDRQMGRTLLDRLGWGAVQHMLSFRTAVGLGIDAVIRRVFIAMTIGLTLAFAAGLTPATLAYTKLFVSVGLLSALWTLVTVMFPLLGRIEVLPDRVTCRAGRRELVISITAIAEVGTYLEPTWRRPQIVGVRIKQESGEIATIPVGRLDGFGNDARAIVERIEEARQAHSRRGLSE